ncbi:hypothetical protein FOXG_16226 [Fusarium oxysporum f. sp. lycopersici 4287]|uniref:Major facilitator superfamily (MFS) profile domain-containing protein n=2 Tax=Fusarium oxysporum TaxID=5507 RepID=A0A0J9W7X0_FUSO4|nr:hypothetical protein FOXG_06857 [Fusarium oxysporum f. sp. lycopersici 4287]XP_018256850.1 hypothetical protein FOXG_16226 [Fusarium oxysporum f. sp. lycopersici 4287]KNB04850.1 hypothetical protein FOXG_06857 [Fusarium oxysporum f. sp. lycopersici 4287]KNB18805.1 hypothetical protein FOXG_16226 [Fusarium oxysporum f. sp. lycopersici 4287]
MDVSCMVRVKAMDRGAVESLRSHQLEASHVSDTTRLLGTGALGTQDKRHEASKVLSWWQRPSAPLSAIVTPKLGHLSDRCGRTRLMALASCGGLVAEFITILVARFPQVIDYRCMFVIIIGFIVPESLSKKKQLLAREKWDKEQELRAQIRRSLLSTIQTVNPFEPLKVLCPTGPGTSPALRRNLVALALNDIIIFGISQAAGAVIILYSEYIYGWGTFESSRFVSVLSLVRVVALMGIFPIINYFGRVRPAARRRRECLMVPAKKHYGADNLDIWVLRAALTSDILGSIGYSLSHSEEVFFLSGMVTAMGGLGSAAIQAIVTKHVPTNRVGQVLGAVGMLLALSRILGPLLFNGIYAATVGTFSQAIFVLLVSMYGISFLASFVIRAHGELLMLSRGFVYANKMCIEHQHEHDAYW